jgi:hypothetical protein
MLMFFFFIVVVADACFVVNASKTVRCTGFVEHCLSEGGFAASAVP